MGVIPVDLVRQDLWRACGQLLRRAFFSTRLSLQGMNPVRTRAFLLLLLICVGCNQPSPIVGKWRPLDADGKRRSTTIEFFANGNCRLDLSGKTYGWTLSGRQLTLRSLTGSKPRSATADFPDLQHMDFAPLDEQTGQKLPPQRLERVTE